MYVQRSRWPQLWWGSTDGVLVFNYEVGGAIGDCERTGQEFGVTSAWHLRVARKGEERRGKGGRRMEQLRPEDGAGSTLVEATESECEIR